MGSLDSLNCCTQSKYFLMTVYLLRSDGIVSDGAFANTVTGAYVLIWENKYNLLVSSCFYGFLLFAYCCTKKMQRKKPIVKRYTLRQTNCVQKTPTPPLRV